MATLAVAGVLTKLHIVYFRGLDQLRSPQRNRYPEDVHKLIDAVFRGHRRAVAAVCVCVGQDHRGAGNCSPGWISDGSAEGRSAHLRANPRAKKAETLYAKNSRANNSRSHDPPQAIQMQAHKSTRACNPTGIQNLPATYAVVMDLFANTPGLGRLTIGEIYRTAGSVSAWKELVCAEKYCKIRPPYNSKC